MAIKIQKSFAVLIIFWVGLVVTPLSLWLIASNISQVLDYYWGLLILGLIGNITSINYYRKQGWSELGWNSAGCVVGFIFLLIISSLFNYFFS
jgi:hypothetical protein